MKITQDTRHLIPDAGKKLTDVKFGTYLLNFNIFAKTVFRKRVRINMIL